MALRNCVAPAGLSFSRIFMLVDSETKITFSKHELVCLQDTDFLLTKRVINEKVQTLLLKLASELANEPSVLPLAPIRTKISKGENYRGLPYWVLDYPAIFTQENTFAYRTICRWGHEFSFTLHLSGTFLAERKAALTANYHNLAAQPGLYLCVNTTQWEHHFEPDNYRLFNEVLVDASDWERFLSDRGFIKLAIKTPLDEWDGVVMRGVEVWRGFSKIV
jgi:hypothetical protein